MLWIKRIFFSNKILQNSILLVIFFSVSFFSSAEKGKGHPATTCLREKWGRTKDQRMGKCTDLDGQMYWSGWLILAVKTVGERCGKARAEMVLEGCKKSALKRLAEWPPSDWIEKEKKEKEKWLKGLSDKLQLGARHVKTCKTRNRLDLWVTHKAFMELLIKLSV